MWMWLDSSPSVRIRTYLDRVFVRRADTEFVRCPTFHWRELTDHKLVRASLQLVNRPNLIGYRMFSTSLLEKRDFRERPETLIQRALVEAVTENKWWGSLQYKIKDFAIKCSKQFNLNWDKKAKSLYDRFSRAVERGDFLDVDLARRDLEHEASERYKCFVVRARLKRVPYVAVKCGVFVRTEEVRRFSHRYTEFVKSPDGHMQSEMRGAFRAHFRDRFARCPDHSIQEFRSYLADLLRQEAEAALLRGFCFWMWSPWCVEAGRPQQIARSVLEDIAHICPYSDGWNQPLVCPWCHS